MKIEIQNALKLLDAEPGNPDALAALAAAAEGGGNGKSDPAAGRALAESRRLHRDRGDFELVARLLDLELGWEKDPGRRADLLIEKGKVLVDELLDEQGGEAALREALRLRPGDEAADEALSQMQLVRDNWQKVLAKYVAEAKEATDKALAASLHVSIAELCWKSQPGSAEVEENLRKALEIDPRNRKAAVHLERFLRQAERFADLGALYEQREGLPGLPRDEKVALLLSLAEIQAERLQRADLAVETLQRVLVIDPAQPRALKAAVAALTEEGDWSGLVHLYEAALKVRRGADTPQTVALVAELGSVLWQRLGQEEAAEPHFGRVRKADPTHPMALEFYRAYYGDRNEGTKLLQVLQAAQKAEQDPRRRLALAVETARTAESPAGNPEKAIDLWKGVLRTEPQNAEAITALKRLYTAGQKWNALLELVKDQVERVALPAEPGADRDQAVDRRIALLLEVVAIYRDRLNLPVMAVNTYNAILALRPDHEGALAALAAKYEEMGRWSDLIGVLQRTADAQSDNVEGRGRKAELLRRIASLWVEKFGNHGNAIKPLEELYGLSPDDEAASRLREIYTKRRAWKPLLALERKELGRLAGDARRGKLIDMARLAAEKLGEPREAISLWNQLLEADPNDVDALGALAVLYDREKRYPALVEVLRRQRPLLPDVKAQVAALEKIGALCADKLGSPALAVNAYREILGLQPNHPKAMRTLRELLVSSGDFEGLERLYAEHGTYEELCETLLQVAERHADPATRLSLNLRVAELALTRLKQPERAVKAYERILGVDPQNKAAAESLLPLYRRAEKWPRLLAMYEIAIGHADSDEERFELYRQVAELSEQRLGSKQQAFLWSARAYGLRSDDAELEAHLFRLAREADSYDELATLLDQQLGRTPEGARRIERLRQLGDLVLNKLGRSAEARRYYEELLGRVPGDPQALDALEKIHSQQGSHVELLKVLRQRLDGTSESGPRIELLYKIAWIEEEQASDLDAAARTYQLVLEKEPHAQRALRALERIYSARSDYGPLADVVRRQLEAVESDRDAAEQEVQLAWRLGDIYEQHLEQPATALPYYERAFARQPAHRETLIALERYLSEGNPARVQVARLLEPVYDKAEEVDKQVGALRILLGASSDEAEQLHILRTLAKLTGRRLGDAEAAYGYAGRIFERLPGDQEVRRDLSELADVLDLRDDYAKKLAAAEERVADEDRALARDLAWELGILLEERLKRPGDAEQAYHRVLERDEHHEGALMALDRLYRGAGRFGELRELLRRRMALQTSEAARTQLLLQIAELDEKQLGDPRAACATYLEILDLDPVSGAAFEALERIYTAQRAFRDLDALLERMGTTVESRATRADLQHRRGVLHVEQLGDAPGAADLFEAALAEEPGHAGARAGLETLLDRSELRQRAARVLEPLYLADEDWPKLVVVLEAQREGASGRDAVDLLARIAKLAEERLADPDKAFSAWREAFRLEPADETAAAEMERLALGLDRHRDLAEAWEEGERLADSNDLALRQQHLERAARLWDHPLADTARARAAWRRLLDLDPTHLSTARPAAEALARIYRGEERWNELVEILRQQASWAESEPVDGKDKKFYLREVAAVHEDPMRDLHAAVAAHREILDLDPEDGSSLDALERLHEVQAQWPELIEILHRRLDLARDPLARRDLLWRIAQLTEMRLTPPAGPWDEAIAAFANVLDEQPEDVPALETLARLYQKSERFVDLLDVLERRLALAAAATLAERQALRERIAALQAGPLSTPELALERWREMLQEDPDSEPARRGLEGLLGNPDLRLTAAKVLQPVYERRGETDRVIHLCELWAEHAGDLGERVKRLRTIATLQEGKGQPRAAFDALARAARLAVAEPELQGLLAELERLVTPQGRPSGSGLAVDLIALYRDLGPDMLDPALQQGVYLSVAARSQELGDHATAREYYRRVLDAQPDHDGALEALEVLYREGEDWAQLLEIYTRRAELAGDDLDLKCGYLVQAATLTRVQLDRPDDAVGFYEQILDLFPADLEAMRSLEQLFEQAGRHADLADLLERRLGFTEEVHDAVALRVRLGDIYAQQLSDSARAIESYHAALSGDSNHAAAILALERFLDDPDYRGEAAEVLEPVYAGRHDWKALIRIYQIRLDATEEPSKRLQLTRRIARLYEDQLEDLDGAFRWYGRVFREEPDDRNIREQLSRLANILGAHAQMAEVYEEWLKDVYEETPASMEVLRTLASIYDGRLNDPDKAKACYLRLLAHDPADANAFHLLEGTLTRAQRWTDLLSVYRDAADTATDMKRRKSLLLKICNVQRHALEDRDGAIDAYREVLDLDPDDAGAVQMLDELYIEGERWDDLIDLLGRQLDKADAPRRTVLKLRLGQLYHEKLGDLTASVDAYEEVISVDPESREALRALEKLILEKDVRFRITEILEPIYRAHDEWAKLVVIYEAQLEFIDDKLRRVELLREIARLHAERGGNLDLAFNALSRAWLEEAPEGEDREAPIFESLTDLSLQLGNWRELIRVLEQGIASTYDDDLRARVFARTAEIQDQRLRDPASAIDSWRRVTSLRDDDSHAWKALERLLSGQERPTDLVEVLEKRISLSSDLREQKALAYRAADLYERVLAKPDRAIATWRQVLSLDDMDRPALGALERLYGQSGDYRELAWVYSREIEMADTDLERRPLWFSLAETYEKAAEVHEAITAYKGALDETPGHREAIDALLRLYEQEALWPELLETLDVAAGISQDDEERHELQYRAARVLEEKLGEALGAIDRYGRILEEQPYHAGSRNALEELIGEEDTREAAAAVLDPLYRRTGEYGPLVAVLERKLAGEGDAATRCQLLGQIAELHEVGLEDAQAAWATWSRVLVEDAGDASAQEQIERLTARLGTFSELARVYAERIDAVFDPDVQRTLSLKLAALHEEQLASPRKAIEYFRRALDLQGEELSALAALDRLLSRELQAAPPGDGARLARELSEVLEREATAVEEPAVQADLYSRLGELRRDHLDDVDEALAAWREAIERAPDHAGARRSLEALLSSTAHAQAVLDLLEPLYDAGQDHEKRVWLLEKRLEVTSDPVDRAQLLSRATTILETELGNPVRALQTAARALAETPSDPQLADELERLAALANAPGEAAAAFERILDQGVPQEPARELGLRAARLWERLGAGARAEARYLGVADIDADNTDALVALERIYRSRNDSAHLTEILEKRAAVELDPNDRKALLSQVAALREGPLLDELGAVAAWKQVLAIDDADVRALSALAHLHEAAGRWADLVEVLEQHSRFAADPQEQAAIKARVARLWAERLGDLDRAVEAWREVLDQSPGATQALAALEDLHTRRQDFGAVQDVLVQQLSLGSAAEQVPIYHRLAQLSLGPLASPDDAIGYLQAILDIVPDDEETIARLEEIFEAHGRWYDLVDLLRKHAELVGALGEREREVALLVRTADVMEDKLDDPAGATDVLEMILARDPTNLRALGSLAKTYEASHDLERCKETLERAAALGGTGADAAQIRFRLGRIEDELQGSGAGEQYYKQALELDPTHAEALHALEVLVRERGDWKRVAELLALRAEVSDRSAQEALWLEVAKILSEKLGQPEEALGALERARALAPSDPGVLEPLAEAYFAASRLDQALAIFQSLIDSTLAANKGRKTKDLARLHFRVGGIAEKLGDTAKAMEQYNAAYAIDAGHAPTLSAIGRLAMATQDWDKARRVFRSLLLQNLDPATGVRKSDVYLALGEIHERTNEASKAVGMYERGLEMEPGSERLKEALARVKAAR